MLGSSLLVAPVFREDGVVEYYVPRGRWTDLLTGQTIDGGGCWRARRVTSCTSRCSSATTPCSP